MPLITRLFIKSAFIYLMAALLTGLLLAVAPRLDLPPVVHTLNPVYFHLFLVGWVTQVIIGVGYWMFPKFSREQPRGSAPLAWATYFLLNLGLLLRVVAEPIITLQASDFWGGALVAAAVLQWLAALTFVANTWPRIKEK